MYLRKSVGLVCSTMPAPHHTVVFVFGAQLTMYTYDWLLSAAEEAAIVSARGGLTWPLAVYFVSRASEFTRSLLLVLFTTAQLHSCTPISALLGTVFVLSVASTSMMFLLRVRAVYLNSTRITTLFALMWLGTVTLTVVTDLNMRADHQLGSRICIDEDLARYAAFPVYATFFGDTMVFVAITYRLMADAATGDDWHSRLLSMVQGRGLRRLSRSLLQSGQLYYFAAILFFFANLAALESPLITTTADHVILVNMYTSFTNMMACLALRSVILGNLQREGVATELSSTALAAAFQLEPLATGWRRG
ncbi:hypothetical protein HWV62_26871 [Athelia sp. TMB]|nr:hypothetical protein HWV62_26871 [Athelia sp. TMB]